MNCRDNVIFYVLKFPIQNLRMICTQNRSFSRFSLNKKVTISSGNLRSYFCLYRLFFEVCVLILNGKNVIFYFFFKNGDVLSLLYSKIFFTGYHTFGRVELRKELPSSTLPLKNTQDNRPL